MGDKKKAIENTGQLSTFATVRGARQRQEFLAAIREGEESLDRGEGIPQQKVEKHFRNWVGEWRSRK